MQASKRTVSFISFSRLELNLSSFQQQQQKARIYTFAINKTSLIGYLTPPTEHNSHKLHVAPASMHSSA